MINLIAFDEQAVLCGHGKKTLTEVVTEIGIPPVEFFNCLMTASASPLELFPEVGNSPAILIWKGDTGAVLCPKECYADADNSLPGLVEWLAGHPLAQTACCAGGGILKTWLLPLLPEDTLHLFCTMPFIAGKWGDARLPAPSCIPGALWGFVISAFASGSDTAVAEIQTDVPGRGPVRFLAWVDGKAAEGAA